MRTLSLAEPETTYFDLEPIVCDADSMVDVLFAAIDSHFAVKPNLNGEYVLSENEGSRLFFLVGIAAAMVGKVREAYYVAHANDRKAKGGAA